MTKPAISQQSEGVTIITWGDVEFTLYHSGAVEVLHMEGGDMGSLSSPARVDLSASGEVTSLQWAYRGIAYPRARIEAAAAGRLDIRDEAAWDAWVAAGVDPHGHASIVEPQRSGGRGDSDSGDRP
jgi:hypothetical protein